MDLFKQLGAGIEETWRSQNYNEEAFPAIASDALRRADISSKISAWDVVEWALQQPELPPQKDPTANFGDPPITLYVAPRFYIDVYFWLDGTTQVHQHSFCGAFQVFLGSSLHSWYNFDRAESINAFTETGTMRLKVCELLKVGNVKEIRAGREYIHSLFHLDQPSATIVVRTEKSPMHLPQFSYHKPSIALDPFFEHQTTTKKLQSIRALYQVNRPDADRQVSELLESADFQTSFAVLSTVHAFLSHGEMGRLFNLEGPPARFKTFLEIVARRHGTKAADLPAVFAHRDRENEIVRRRGYVTDPEHRFFLAMLLNVDDRDTILQLTGERFSGTDPMSKILDWIYDLAQTRVVGVNTPNALGIDDFTDVDLSIVEHMMRGRSDQETREAITSEYGAEKSADLESRLAKVSNSAIFRPLFRGQSA